MNPQYKDLRDLDSTQRQHSPRCGNGVEQTNGLNDQVLCRLDAAASRIDSVSARLERMENRQLDMAENQQRMLQLCAGVTQARDVLLKVASRINGVLPKKQEHISEQEDDEMFLSSFSIDEPQPAVMPTLWRDDLISGMPTVWRGGSPKEGASKDEHEMQEVPSAQSDTLSRTGTGENAKSSISPTRRSVVSFEPGRLFGDAEEFDPEDCVISTPLNQHRKSLGTSVRSSAASMPVSAQGSINTSFTTVTVNSRDSAREPIPIREGWEKIGRSPGRATMAGGRMSLAAQRMSLSASSGERSKTMDSLTDGIFVAVPEGRFKAFSPDGSLRTSWDVTSMFMLLYDAFTVPYILAFNLNVVEGLWYFFSWCTRLFWTFDLPLSVFTGFRTKEQKLEIRLEVSAVKYMKTWFVPDIIFVVCDWASLFLSENDTMQFVKNLLRVLRLVRGVRQAPRAAALWQKALLASPYKEIQLLMDIFRLVMIILWANHVVSCVWYAIGTQSESDTDQTWLSVNPMFDIAGEQYQYSTALHWAMTQMTPGSMEVVPKNTTERFYNVGCLFFGLILGSSLVATLTSMMTQYRMQSEDFTKKSVQLQRYLGQLKVAPDLAMAIKLQVRLRAKEVKRLKAREVHYLSLMSEGLKEEMHYQFYSALFSKHVFMNLWNQVDEVSMRSLCSKTLTEDFSATDIIFKEEAAGDTMYFLIGGTLSYTPSNSEAPTQSYRVNKVATISHTDQVTWCSEPALWTDWIYQGTLSAVATAEVLKISASSLQKDLTKFPRIGNVLKEYCIAFHRYINEPGVVCSDLSIYGMDHYEIISTLPLETRLILAEPVLRDLQEATTTFFGTKKDMSMLEDEVHKGKSNVAFFNGQAVRTVFVVALRIARNLDDRFLVQIGEVMKNSSNVKKDCVLPGLKRREREGAHTATERLIDEDFPLLKDSVRINYQAPCEHSIFSKYSESYGIHTRYSRTVFRARLMKTDELLNELVKIELPKERKVRTSDIVRKSTKSTRTTMTTMTERVLSMKSGQKRSPSDPSSKVAKGASCLEALDILQSSEAVTMKASEEDEKVDHKIFLWLSEDEFKTLQDPDAEAIRNQWTSALVETTRDMFRPVTHEDSIEDSQRPPSPCRSGATISSDKKASVFLDPGLKRSHSMASVTDLIKRTFSSQVRERHTQFETDT